jgi:hypothetical protein
MVRLTDLAIYRKARALGTYWDSLVRHQAVPAEASAPSADELVTFIHDLHRAWESNRRLEPTDDPVLNDLLAKHQEMNAMATTAPYLANPTIVPRPTPAEKSWSLPSPATHPNRQTVALAVAVVIIVIGALAVAAWRDRGEQGRQADGPAIHAPATPLPEDAPSAETLMLVQVPADLLPTGRDISAGLVGFTIPVGASSAWTPICCTGPLVEYVVSGTYTVRAHEPITVVRADGTVEAIGADTAVTLGPGDGLLSHNENVVEASNSGTTPVDLLQWVMIDDTAKFNEHKPSGWVRTGGPNIQRSLTPSDSPMMITLRKVTAENGAKIAAPDGGSSVQFAIPADPDTGLIGNSSDGSIVVYGEAETLTTVYILTATQLGGEGGTPAS